MSATATRFRPSTDAIASKWFLLMRPHPTSPTRNACPASAVIRRLRPVSDSGDSVAATLVGHSTRLTGSGAAVRQALPALTHPTDAPRGNAGHERVGHHVFGDHRPRADERIFTERRAADDGRVRAD